jgi:hypothetical protein
MISNCCCSASSGLIVTVDVCIDFDASVDENACQCTGDHADDNARDLCDLPVELQVAN